MNIATMNSVVPDAIERIINEKGMKKCVVAARADLTPQELADMLNGRKLIKAKDIVNISAALNVAPSDLFPHKP